MCVFIYALSLYFHTYCSLSTYLCLVIDDLSLFYRVSYNYLGGQKNYEKNTCFSITKIIRFKSWCSIKFKRTQTRFVCNNYKRRCNLWIRLELV